MYGDYIGQVVLCVYRRAQIEDAQGGVGGNGGDERRVRGAVGGAVGAAADGERLDGLVACWGPLGRAGKDGESVSPNRWSGVMVVKDENIQV